MQGMDVATFARRLDQISSYLPYFPMRHVYGKSAQTRSTAKSRQSIPGSESLREDDSERNRSLTDIGVLAKDHIVPWAAATT